MRIHKLNLRNYRNHIKLALDLDANLVVITGPNGTGKTNILEAVNILSHAKSTKSYYDKDLINYEYSFCTIVGHVTVEQQEKELEVQIIKSPRFENGTTKKVKVNKVAKSVRYFTGLFNTVFFIPEDIQLITGSPSERRKYLDALLSQVDQEYKTAHSEYQKALRQRNKLLELISEEGRGLDQLDFWSEKIVTHGQYIQQKRQEVLTFFRISVSNYSRELNGTDYYVDIEYLKNEASWERLESHKVAEIGAKSTLVGPHRDDFVCTANGKDISQFGSRGQQRSLLLALKLSEIDYIESIKKERPVLLLDDIFSEMDAKHRKALIELVDKQQTLITHTDPMPELEAKPHLAITLPTA